MNQSVSRHDLIVNRAAVLVWMIVIFHLFNRLLFLRTDNTDYRAASFESYFPALPKPTSKILACSCVSSVTGANTSSLPSCSCARSAPNSRPECKARDDMEHRFFGAFTRSAMSCTNHLSQAAAPALSTYRSTRSALFVALYSLTGITGACAWIRIPTPARAVEGQSAEKT